jgi:ribosomal protein L16/L10AE
MVELTQDQMEALRRAMQQYLVRPTREWVAPLPAPDDGETPEERAS